MIEQTPMHHLIHRLDYFGRFVFDIFFLKFSYFFLLDEHLTFKEVLGLRSQHM